MNQENQIAEFEAKMKDIEALRSENLRLVDELQIQTSQVCVYERVVKYVLCVVCVRACVVCLCVCVCEWRHFDGKICTWWMNSYSG